MDPRLRATIQTLRTERRRFKRFCTGLSPEDLARSVPGSDWTVKDFVIHVATLDAAYRGWFEALAGGPAVAQHRGSPDFDVDAYNESAVAARRDLSLDAILAEGDEFRTAVVAALSRLGDHQLDASVRFGGDRKRPARTLSLVDLLRGWPRHDAIHVADILKAIPHSASAPEAVNWLHEPDVAAAVEGYRQAMA